MRAGAAVVTAAGVQCADMRMLASSVRRALPLWAMSKRPGSLVVTVGAPSIWTQSLQHSGCQLCPEQHRSTCSGTTTPSSTHWRRYQYPMTSATASAPCGLQSLGSLGGSLQRSQCTALELAQQLRSNSTAPHLNAGLCLQNRVANSAP
jgi:hypothetical protein